MASVLNLHQIGYMADSKGSKWAPENIPDLDGRTIVITGANSGIGFETARILAARGALIIIPARTLHKSEDAATRIRQEHTTARLVCAELDLASVAKIRTFERWLSESFPGESIDCLINNAGVMAVPKRELTADGFERQFGTNFLGPFALTALVYPHLKKRTGTRIVIVTSAAAQYGKINFDNLQSEQHYKAFVQAYPQSKLADSIFALELSRRLQAIRSPIACTAAHPGYAKTNLQKTGPGRGFSLVNVLSFLFQPLAQPDAAHGAYPTLYAATSQDAQDGSFYGPGGLMHLRGAPAENPWPTSAKNKEVASLLWKTAELLTKTPFPL